MVRTPARIRTARTVAGLVAVLILFGTAIAPVAPVAAQTDSTTDVSIRGEPYLSVSAADSTLAPGQTTALTLQVTNDGELDWGSPDQRDAVVTARDVRVEATADDAPFEIESDVVAVGAVGEDRPREVPIAITVPENAEQGTYEVDVEVSYSHVSQYWTSGKTTYAQEHSHETSETVEVDVDETARFELSNVTTDAQVGSNGTLEATLENVGSANATNARLALDAGSSSLTLGGGKAEEVYVGSMAPGETTTVTTDVAVRPDAAVSDYSIGGTVRYADPDGFSRTDPDLTAGIRPAAEQDFSIANASSTLRAGEERHFAVTVRNDGPRPIHDPVVTLVFDNPNVYLDTPQQSIAGLGPNESARVTYAVDVSESVQASTQRATLTVGYTDGDDTRRKSDSLFATAAIDRDADRFDVEVVNGTVAAGSTDTVDLRVTNLGDRRISEVEAKTYLDDPLDSNADEALIPVLEPGESKTVTFDVDAAAGAPPKTYALSTDFHYELPDGDAELSRTYAVPINVVSPPDTQPTWLLAVPAVLLLGLVWQRDRILNLVR